VVQCDGEITDGNERTGRRVRSTDVGRRLVAGFDIMLEEQLSGVLVGPVADQSPLFDDRRGLLEWRGEPFSATAAFLIAVK
jgi:hypothetical protein